MEVYCNSSKTVYFLRGYCEVMFWSTLTWEPCCKKLALYNYIADLSISAGYFSKDPRKFACFGTVVVPSYTYIWKRWKNVFYRQYSFKGAVSQDFRPFCFVFKDSTWAPYEQEKMVLRNFLFSRRYLIAKF